MGRGASGTNPYNSTDKGKIIAVNGNGNRISAAGMAVILSSESSIKDMKNRDMQKEVQQAISRYEAKMGLREKRSHGIFLDKKLFDVPKKQFEAEYKKSNYKRRGGYKNVTRNAAQHTVTHELAHATWCSDYVSTKHQAAGKEIKKLYKKFIADKSSVRKKNYGSYGTGNVDEFWAEVITKGIHGDNDSYTRKAFKIAKRYKL